MNITDQMANAFSFSSPPKRIISLVPSQTELLYDLGLEDEVIGITNYCIHPNDWHVNKIKVGGTKKIDIQKILELKPDLVIGNKEENEKSQIEELMKHIPIWMSDIETLADALKMIEGLSQITGKEAKGLKIQNDIKEQFSHFKLQLSKISLATNRAAYFIWRKPFIVAGGNTFIDHLLEVCGLVNIFRDSSRYPELTAAQIQQADPSIIFLSSEPFPFKEQHIKEFREICPYAKVVLVDGEMFSWYGSRLIFAPAYFERLLRNL